MFGILKLLMGVVVLALFVWFGANVQLGSRTLFQHLQAIGSTRQTQDLMDGTRRSAQPIVDGVKKRLSSSRDLEDESRRAVPDAGGPPADQIPEADRQRLRKVLGGGHQAR
jgi:hypothetical protein